MSKVVAELDPIVKVFGQVSHGRSDGACFGKFVGALVSETQRVRALNDAERIAVFEAAAAAHGRLTDQYKRETRYALNTDPVWRPLAEQLGLARQ